MKGVISVKKRLIPLIFILSVLLAVPAYAASASPRIITILPALSFDGTTANCRVSVSANHGTDRVEADIALWDGATCIANWDASGTGYLLFSNSTQVTRGRTYELTVDVTIDGVDYERVSIKGPCD